MLFLLKNERVLPLPPLVRRFRARARAEKLRVTRDTATHALNETTPLGTRCPLDSRLRSQHSESLTSEADYTVKLTPYT